MNMFKNFGFLLLMLSIAGCCAMTPLHEAVRDGGVAGVQALITAHANIHAQDTLNRSPLHYAVGFGHLAIVQVLLGVGANINTQDYYGDTPLHCAASYGYLKIVQVLLGAGANINTQDKYGQTPLHMAADEGRLEVVEALIRAGANIDVQDIYGGTPLHRAAKPSYFKFLEREKAIPERVAVIQVLITAGANINAQRHDGMTPLHCAVAHGRLAAVQVLIAADAHISLLNDAGRLATQLRLLNDAERFAEPREIAEFRQIADYIDACIRRAQEAGVRRAIAISRILARAMHPRLGGHDAGTAMSPFAILPQDLLRYISSLTTQAELHDAVQPPRQVQSNSCCTIC